MIGYYIHHVGLGHLHRALAAVQHLPGPVTALTSLPPDERWPGPRLRLARDDAGPPPRNPTAGGYLHWAPLNDPGLRERMGAVAGWITQHRPSVMVVDLSVEVVALSRLMGVPVVAVSLPGSRNDPAHQRGYELADAIIAPWPERYRELGPDLARFAGKVHHVGGVSRYESRSPGATARRQPGRVLAMSGLGSSDPGLRISVGAPPVAGWDWHGIGAGNWDPDPWNEIRTAQVVVTHAGLGALADVAMARRPAVVIPQERPHEEQVTTAAVLARAGLATVVAEAPTDPDRWRDLLETARDLGGDRWNEWADGHGGRRMAQVIADVGQVAQVSRVSEVGA